MANNTETEVFELCNVIMTLTKDTDPYAALGAVMGVFAGQMSQMYGPTAVDKFTSEYVDVITALIIRANGMRQ